MSARAWFWLACFLSLLLAALVLSGVVDQLKFRTALYVTWGFAVGIGVAAAQSLRKDER